MNTQDLLIRNDAALEVLVGLLSELDADRYQQVDPVVQGSIGTHVRHCIEFYDALLDDHDSGVVCYHRRPRRLEFEVDLPGARSKLSSLRQRLETLGSNSKTLRVAHFGGTTSDSCTLRELSYVLDHTVHHTALIRVIASTLGVELDSAFGFAASTLASRQSAG